MYTDESHRCHTSRPQGNRTLVCGLKVRSYTTQLEAHALLAEGLLYLPAFLLPCWLLGLTVHTVVAIERRALLGVLPIADSFAFVVLTLRVCHSSIYLPCALDGNRTRDL